MPEARPDWTAAVERLLALVTSSDDDLRALDARRILVVALAAHGTAVATVRTLTDCASRVVVDEQVRTWELGLRPAFFHEGDAPRRLATLVHELLHLDPHHDGALLHERRHAQRPHAVHEKQARSIAREFLQQTPPLELGALAHDGEVRVRQWLRRPVDATARKRFSDADVFDGIVHIHTPSSSRAGWW